MHFPIIKIEKIDTPREDWDTDLDLDDPCLLANTDYFGDIYDESERQVVIKSNWLKSLFEGIATIDTEKETVTFLNPDTIKTTIQNYLIFKTSELHTAAMKKTLQPFELKFAGATYKGCEALFVLDYGMTSFDFITDSYWYAGETWQIGNIFDAHI